MIKNVAGYDLAKLVHGAYGTLAVIAEVVLRLHPLPHATATLVLPCPLQEAAEHAARILGGPYEPAALEWVSDPGALLVRVEGTEAALPERVDRLRELLGAAAARRAAGTPRTRGPGTPGSPAGRSTTPYCGSGCAPPGCPGVLAGLDTRSVTAGLGTGVATVALPADPVAVAAAHAAVHAAGGTSVLRSRPVGLDASGVGSGTVRARRAPRRQAGARPRRPPRTGPARTVADREEPHERGCERVSARQRPSREAPTERSEGVQ